MQQRVNEYSFTTRNIKPIIYLVLQVQDFLYHTLMSQHSPSLQMSVDLSRWNIPNPLMCQTVVQPALTLYTE